MTDEIDLTAPARRRAVVAFASAGVVGVPLTVVAALVPGMIWLVPVALGAFTVLLLIGGLISLAVARQSPRVRHLGGLIVLVRVAAVIVGAATAVIFYFSALLAGGLSPALISLGVVFGLTFLVYQTASLNADAVHDAQYAEPPAS